VNLNEEFDPEAYDKQMASVFDENYYNDAGDQEKPVFDEEEGTNEPQKTKFDEYMETDFEEKLASDTNFEKYLDEYYQLDYEDMIAGIPCRFKYADVKPINYGINSKQILESEDTQLKQIVPLKRLAPYREDQGIVHGSWRRRGSHSNRVAKPNKETKR